MGRLQNFQNFHSKNIVIVLSCSAKLYVDFQVGEVCASGITFINSNYNGALVHGSGRIIMVLGVVLMSAFVFLRNLRQLEIAGDFGFIVVLIMVIVIMVRNSLTLKQYSFHVSFKKPVYHVFCTSAEVKRAICPLAGYTTCFIVTSISMSKSSAISQQVCHTV